MGPFHRVGVFRKQEFMRFRHVSSQMLGSTPHFRYVLYLKVPVTPRSSDSCGVVSYSPVSPARCRGRQFYTRSGRCVGPKYSALVS
jgi:hypothetical protein